MMQRLSILIPAALCTLGASAHTALLAFESASASSRNVAGNFGAEEALTKGSGYWCSSGGHGNGHAVSWTGNLGARQEATGLRLHWSYGPGEFKVLTSSDGGNFEEAACWRKASRPEVSYEEVVAFDTPRKVKAVKVVMRSPQPWGYFGLNHVALMAEPGPVMLVSGAAQGAGESCLVADGAKLVAMECLKAIAQASGGQVFSLSQDSQLVSLKTGDCVCAAEDGSELRLRACEEAAEAGDGKDSFKLTPSGQLQVVGMGSTCVRVSGSDVALGACDGELAGAAGSTFFMAAVPEYDAAPAAVARDAAGLLLASAARQRALLQDLQAALPKLSSCHFALGMNVSLPAVLMSESGKGHAAARASDSASGLVDAALGIDVAALGQLMRDSAAALNQITAAAARA